MTGEPVSYIHPALNEPCEAIGGHYVLTDEHRMTIDGEDVLVFIGYGVVDSSCCGPGGCRYAVVPGVVQRYRHGQNPDGMWISEVIPVTASHLQLRIRSYLLNTEKVQQVQFL